ncbi:hypothetical protein D8W71_13380 [Rhodococcus sp. P1Y]|nr:hypothetical protein D8W71_13380 [Rhodococcus sp. P1Y]
MHPELLELKRLVFDIDGSTLTDIVQEAESAEYGACAFLRDTVPVRFRVARTTPKKIGQFVTFWKRAGNGPIEPFDENDDLEILVVVTRTPERFGYFEFPKHVLRERGVLSMPGKEGKRAFRVYPTWDSPVSRTALATQLWQSRYFTDLSPGTACTLSRRTDGKPSILLDSVHPDPVGLLGEPSPTAYGDSR